MLFAFSAWSAVIGVLAVLLVLALAFIVWLMWLVCSTARLIQDVAGAVSPLFRASDRRGA